MCDRVCSRCGETHPITFFNRDRTRKDGIYPHCKNCSRKAVRESYAAHRDAHIALKRAWKNANRERHREINRAYQKAYPERGRLTTAKYRAAWRIATPPWMNKHVILAFYEKAPPGHHVDHIEPLQGKDRCGLNVPWNLQYLPAELSFKKGNRPYPQETSVV